MLFGVLQLRNIWASLDTSIPRNLPGTSIGKFTMSVANRRRSAAATTATSNNSVRLQHIGDRKTSMLQTLASKITDKEWKDRLQRAAREGTEGDVVKVWRMRAGADGAKGAKSREEMMNDALLDAIFEAIQCDRHIIITPLIKCRSTIAARTHGPLEQTALHAAVKKGSGPAQDGSSPSERESSPVIKELLLHSQIIKAIDTGDIYGSTALHEAAKLGELGIIKDLFANRADINAPDHQYITPLHAAVLGGHESALDFLIKNGAEVNTRDQDGKPLTYQQFYSAAVSCRSAISAQVHIDKSG